jgi:hypothetical protein
VVDAVKSAIRENGIDVFTVDPFVSSHRVSENDNGAIEAVAWEWAKIADECNCAIELVHHSRKTGGGEVTTEDARGASALMGKARSVRVLNLMTASQAATVGVENPRAYFRVDDDKPNMAPAGAAEWYRLVSVGLGNATAKRPQDEVGVVVPWQWPDAFDGLPDNALQLAQAALADGQWRASSQAKAWAGVPIAEALKLNLDNPHHKEQIKTLIKEWTKEGAFEVYEAKDDNRDTREFLKPHVAAP